MVTFLIFFYQSFFGPLTKISLFSGKNSKIIIFLFVLVLKKILVILFSWKSVFAINLCFHAWSRKHFAIFCVFNLFLGNYFVSLCLSKKKKWLILYTFSLYFFFFLIRSLFMCPLVMFTLLVVALLIDKKISKKKKTSKKWQKHSFFFSEGSSFSLFSILFHSRKAFFANKHMFYQFYRFVSLSFKNYPSKETLTEGRLGIQSGKSM